MRAKFLLQNTFDLLFKRKLAFQFDRIPLQAEKISNQKLINLFRIGLNRLFPVSRIMGYPYMAHISPAGLCNLSCALCPVHDPELKGKTLLPFDTFKKFIDETGDYLIYIILWSWGEPFLNPEIYRMIKYASEKGILSVTSSNMNKFSMEEAEALIDSGLDALIIAVDGTTEETYARLRSGGDFNKVKANTRMLVETKQKFGSKKPIINLRMVVSRDNESEIEDFKQLARDLSVDMVSFKAFSTRQMGYRDPEYDRRFAPDSKKYRWYRYHPDFSPSKKPKKYNCRFSWTKPTLFPDGTIIACEFDFKYEQSFGNIKTQTFKDIWFGPKIKRFRKQFLKNRDRFDFCKDCVYDYKLIEGCVIEWELLKDAG
jgi:radical SAM protein with 4Fe4S-binding SPASM domain